MSKRLFTAILSMLRSPRRMAGRTWATELFVRTTRGVFIDGGERGLDWLRLALDRASLGHPAQKNVETIVEGIADVPCLITRPTSGCANKRVILYFHGGGYVAGSPAGYKPLLAQLAVNSDCTVIAPDYRLAPEHPFPAPQDDCLKVALAISEAYPGRRLVVAGDSAGGGLAIATSLELSQMAKPAPDALVLISPWVDPGARGGTMESNAVNDFMIAPFLFKSFALLMAGKSFADPRVNFSQTDLSALPRTLVQCGGGELFFDQIQKFSDRAKKAGVDITLQNYPAQFHDFQMLSAILKDAKHAVREIADFVNQ